MYLGIDLGTSELKRLLGDDGRVIDTEGSALAPGQSFISLGTSGVMFEVTDRFRPNPAQAAHAFCHTLPQRWHQMTVMLSAASALSWLTRLLNRGDESALMTGLEAGELSDAAMARAPHRPALAQR